MISRRSALRGLGAAAVLAASPRAAGGADTHTLTASDVHPKDYPTVQAVEWIGQTLARETDGRLRLRVYHAGQLGRESEAIDMARFGVIDLTRVHTGAVNNAFALTQALCLPFAFESKAHQRRVLDGPVGMRVLEGFAARDLIGLAIYDSGPRCFYNTQRALTTPADLRGLKLRVPPSDISLALLREFGANPTPLAYGETYSALETRLIDGAENNVVSYHASRQFEAAPFWSQSEHSYAPDVLLIGRGSFERLAHGDQDLLREAARASVEIMRTAWDNAEQRARAAIRAAGVRENTVDGAAFRAAAEPVLRTYTQQGDLAALYRGIRAEA
jgi:tripartite ATP-independent transporter DctP family solute receptor